MPDAIEIDLLTDAPEVEVNLTPPEPLPVQIQLQVSQPGISEAPMDGAPYARKNGAWENIEVIDGGILT